MSPVTNLSGLPRSITSVIDRGSILLGWLAIAALVAMMLLTGTDVFLRFFFRSGVFGTVEVIGNYFMVAVVFLPLAFGSIRGGHISVDFVVSNFAPRLRAACEVLGLFLSLVAYVLISWYGALGALHAWKFGDTMVNIRLPMWPGKALVAIGGLFLCLQILLSIFRNLSLLFGKSAGEPAPKE